VNPDLRNLIALQDLEQKIAELQKQVSDIPTEIRALHDELDRLNQAHQARTERTQELAKQRRTLEGEIDLMRAKLSKLRDQLMSVKTNKEYTVMLHEIQVADEQIRNEEDKVLEIMEEAESMEQELLTAEKELNARSAELLEKIRICEASVPGMEAEINKLSNEKASMEAHIEADLLVRYRRLSEARKGMALAEVKDELCQACHVRIRPQVYADVLRTEEIFACDSCSRLLFSREAL
jgi:predicted  nucleic acid-binding Zn-ribbon protein